MTSASLEQEINYAFQNNENIKGLHLLRQLAEAQQQNSETWHRLAVIEEQLGNLEQALLAHLHCIKINPNNSLAHLYTGYCYQVMKKLDKALFYYSYAFDLNQNALSLWQNNNTSKPTATRSFTANQELRKHLSKLHKIALTKIANPTNRIKQAIWTQTHTESFAFNEERQRPQVFYIPNLNAKPFYECSEMIGNWASELEENFAIIQTEFTAALPQLSALARPYLEHNLSSNHSIAHLNNDFGWSAIDVFKAGVGNPKIAKLLEKTLALLSCAPLYRLTDNPFEVFFSVLKPQQHIKTHYGLSNHSLTVHLPIIVPSNCELRVADSRKNWEPGKLIIFDDTFDHEAINRSQKERIVLIFSIWHPDLSNSERDQIKSSFQARQKWLDSRPNLNKL